MKEFDKGAVLISKLAFPFEYRSVHFDQVFARLDEGTRPWQKVIRLKFANLALMGYVRVVEHGDDAENRAVRPRALAQIVSKRDAVPRDHECGPWK